MTIFELRLEQDERYYPLGMFSSIEKAIEYAKTANICEYQGAYDPADFSIVQWTLDTPGTYSTVEEFTRQLIPGDDDEPDSYSITPF